MENRNGFKCGSHLYNILLKEKKGSTKSMKNI